MYIYINAHVLHGELHDCIIMYKANRGIMTWRERWLFELFPWWFVGVVDVRCVLQNECSDICLMGTGGKTWITGYLNVAFETSHPCTPLVDQAGMMRSLISHCHSARLLGFVWLLVVTDILRYLRTWISLLLADPRRFKTACGISILDPGWWFFFSHWGCMYPDAHGPCPWWIPLRDSIPFKVHLHLKQMVKRSAACVAAQWLCGCFKGMLSEHWVSICTLANG